MKSENSLISPFVNFDDPRQDIHKERTIGGNLFRYQLTLRLLPLNLNGTRILELGGGTGDLTKALLQRGADVTFVDLNDSNLQKASLLGAETKKLDLNYGCKSIDDFQYDIVILLEVIEHIVKAEFLLDEAARVLKDEGKLILSTPNFSFVINRLRILLGNLSHDEGYHYRFFNRFSLKKKLTNSGFEVIKEYNNSPAIGLNLFVNRFFKKPRVHIVIPDFISNLVAQTLFVVAKKKRNN